MLHLDQVHSEHVHPTFGEIIDSIRADRSGFTLHTANRLCANNKYSLLDSYVDATKTHYKVTISNIIPQGRIKIVVWSTQYIGTPVYWHNVYNSQILKFRIISLMNELLF